MVTRFIYFYLLQTLQRRRTNPLIVFRWPSRPTYKVLFIFPFSTGLEYFFDAEQVGLRLLNSLEFAFVKGPIQHGSIVFSQSVHRGILRRRCAMENTSSVQLGKYPFSKVPFFLEMRTLSPTLNLKRTRILRFTKSFPYKRCQMS